MKKRIHTVLACAAIFFSIYYLFDIIVNKTPLLQYFDRLTSYLFIVLNFLVDYTPNVRLDLGYYRVKIYLEMGEWERAVSYGKAGLEEDPKHVPSASLLVTAYELMGQRDSAKESIFILPLATAKRQRHWTKLSSSTVRHLQNKHQSSLLKSNLDRGLASAAIFSSVLSMWV